MQTLLTPHFWTVFALLVATGLVAAAVLELLVDTLVCRLRRALRARLRFRSR